MDRISEISQDGLGICGFTCIVQALIDNKKMSINRFIKKYEKTTAFANEWLKIQMKHDLSISPSSKVVTALSQSLKFTGSFGDQFKITIQDLLATEKWDWTKRKGFALTPEAMADYLTRRYKMKISFDLSANDENIDMLKQRSRKSGIYGVKRPNSKELQHWVYVDNKGNLMTWQKENDTAYNELVKTKINKQGVIKFGYSTVVTRIIVKKSRGLSSLF